MHVYCPLALSPEAGDFLHSPENFNLYFTTYTHSPKVFNKNDELRSKINHRRFYCFSFVSCKADILSVKLHAKFFTLCHWLTNS